MPATIPEIIGRYQILKAGEGGMGALYLARDPAIDRQVAGTATAAALHAYLGVAYATRAFSSAKSDEQSRLSGKALGQFKLALSSQHDFQLSRKIVSPKILQMFEQARR